MPRSVSRHDAARLIARVLLAMRVVYAEPPLRLLLFRWLPLCLPMPMICLLL